MKKIKQIVLLLSSVTLASAGLTGCGRPVSAGPTANLSDADKIRKEIKAGIGGGETTGPAVTAAKPTGFASISGTVKISGAAPARKTLTKVSNTCMAGGDMSVLDDAVVVDPNTGAIAWAAIYATNIAPDWCHESKKPGAAKEAVALFDQNQCRFLDHVYALSVSQPMTIKNSDMAGHNTNMQPKANEKRNINLPPGAETTYQHTKEEKEPYSVSCDVHNWMKAYILPRDNGYFSVSKGDGAFDIAQLPSGVDLKLRLWHEKMTPKSIKINGEEVKLDRGVFTLKLADNETKKLEIEISASDIKK